MTDDDEILRLEARIRRVSMTQGGAVLVLDVNLDDDVYRLAQAVGHDCAIALQVAPETVA